MSHLSKSESAESDQSSSSEANSGSAFSSPEAVLSISHSRLGTGDLRQSSNPVEATSAILSTGGSDGVRDILSECRNVMQARQLMDTFL